MKNKIKKLVASVTLLASILSVFSGCGEIVRENDIKINPDQVQLYVFSYAGGYGNEWFTPLKERFEEAHKNDTFTDPTGKTLTGVQIVPNFQKKNTNVIKTNILNGKDEVFFQERARYYELLSEGYLGDITDAVTSEIAGEGKSIKDKFTKQQLEYYGIKDSEGKVCYYGVPHYESYMGLTYNKELFDKKNFYFAKEKDLDIGLEGYFISRSGDQKSDGPDGKPDTYDDGLPATYEEFFLLCEWIKSNNMVPVCWSGESYHDYLNFFLESLSTDYDGVEQTALNYNLSGTATSLVKQINSDGTIELEAPTVIDGSNTYLLAKQAGKYYALKFLDKLFNDAEGKYHNDKAFNKGYGYLTAQQEFIKSGYDSSVSKEIAMFAEGVWWEQEASGMFTSMAQSKGAKCSRENRQFAFMPLPKAFEEKVGEKITINDHSISLCFMKKNIDDWKKQIAYEFIKFANSDQSLVEFTQYTHTTKALKYTMSESDKAKLNTYGRSVMDIKENANVVYPISNASLYMNNQGYYSTHNLRYAKIDEIDVSFAPVALHGGTSVKDYFEGMSTYSKFYYDNFLKK